MRIGIDVDGVLANFIRAYESLIVEVNGRDLFPARWPDVLPPCWDWPQFYGYTGEEIKAAWTVIKASPDFWLNLEIIPGARGFLQSVRAHAEQGAEIYFITDRPGIATQQQTSQWLHIFTGMRPSVIVSGQKGDIAAALKLDYYLDDKLENVIDVQKKSPTTTVRLLNFPYNKNRGKLKVAPSSRVDTLAEFAALIQ